MLRAEIARLKDEIAALRKELENAQLELLAKDSDQ
jgi:hypothetical protein